MNAILQSVVLGIVQGLTEFLPVSSSGHLVLLQKVFGMSSAAPGAADASLMFLDTMLHVGTLLAVAVVLWPDILDLFRRPVNLLYLVLASVPAGIAYLMFPQFFNDAFAGRLLGYSFIITAILLTLSEIISKRMDKKRELKAGGALAMGVMQVVGMLPGVSRSGSTISGGLMFGLDRKTAAKFSFLMSIPAILAPTALQGYDLIKLGSFDVNWGAVIIGTVCAAVSGYIAVKFMLALIQRKRLYGFAIYTGILGILVLMDQYVFGIINWY